MYKSNSSVDAYQQQHDPKADASVTGQSLCPLANCDAPIDHKKPDAISEMPNCRCDADEIDYEDGRIYKLIAHDCEALIPMRSYRQSIESRNQPKPEIKYVKRYEKEENHTRDTLDQIEPIARIGVIQIIGPRLDGYHQAIDGVIDERYKDSADFHKQNIRDRLQLFNGIIEVRRPRQSLGVRIKVF